MIALLAVSAIFLAGDPASPPLDKDPSATSERSAVVDEAYVRGVIERPDSVEPMKYIFVVDYLWARGDRAQAAFWYYLWQNRTRPWAKAGPPEVALGRRLMSAEYGATINEWIGSDADARTDLARRAIAYEARLPLSSDRPSSVTAEQWAAIVGAERNSYAREFEAFLADPRFQGETQREARRANGLYVGSWQSPGTPLPDDWR